MTREEAAAILGCDARSPATVVKGAFADAIKAAHPDSVARNGPHTVAAIKKARDVLLIDAPTDCPQCRGSGWVAVGFRKARCPRGC